MRDVQDHYFKQAKRDGYRSRAAYKLREIDERRSILKPGDVVLDCGAAPGSWLQIASEAVGERGRVVGVDLKPIDPFPNLANVEALVGDLNDLDVEAVRTAARLREHQRFHVVLSDMAPNTTGDRTIDHHGSVRLGHVVLDVCRDLLKKGGHVVIKVLEGEAYADLLARANACFDGAKGFKPAASRNISTEMYIVAKGYQVEAPAPDQHALPSRPRPKGW